MLKVANQTPKCHELVSHELDIAPGASNRLAIPILDWFEAKPECFEGPDQLPIEFLQRVVPNGIAFKGLVDDP